MKNCQHEQFLRVDCNVDFNLMKKSHFYLYNYGNRRIINRVNKVFNESITYAIRHPPHTRSTYKREKDANNWTGPSCIERENLQDESLRGECLQCLRDPL